MTNGPPSTATLPDLFVSGGGDTVRGLRMYGAESARSFPEVWERLRVGNDPQADIFISDPSVSRTHASIRRQNGTIIVADEGSKNGTFVEGYRQSMFELKPGAVVRFGGVSMVAVSTRTESVRARFMRFLGFGPQYLPNVEHAAYASIRRLHVVLYVPKGGFQSLVGVFHQTVPGDTWPLYVVDDRILDTEAAQRLVLRRSRLGTLVVPAEFWPANDAATLVEALIAPARELRMIFVAPRGKAAEHVLGGSLRDLAVSVDYPTPLERGAMEIVRSVQAGVQEHGVPLGLSGPVFSAEEMARLSSAKWTGNAEELEEIVRRVTRVRVSTVAHAAHLEGVTADAMSVWMKRKKFPLRIPSS